ncbi:hypothetical protein F8388_004531 [Cannabis sativa]|uniref:Uncharacterized protein n=1 Tax=Cannabis sativa TaxID=3483 RepID=A0A7J6ENN6_CANSA|nr:hypothetical protein F8388_004531 [Cannabis sativa]
MDSREERSRGGPSWTAWIPLVNRKVRLMSTLNYPCGLEPSQPRHNDAIIRGALYHYANSLLCGPPGGGPLCQKQEKPHPSLSFSTPPRRHTGGT